MGNTPSQSSKSGPNSWNTNSESSKGFNAASSSSQSLALRGEGWRRHGSSGLSDLMSHSKSGSSDEALGRLL